jgi:DNA-binding IclR family transcriptional regulator
MLPVTRQRALLVPKPGLTPGKADAAEWHQLRRDLSETRKRGYYVSRGELDADTVGIALPIVHRALDAPASIVLIMSRARFALTDEQRVVGLLRTAVGRITRGLDDLQPDSSEI